MEGARGATTQVRVAGSDDFARIKLFFRSIYEKSLDPFF